MLARRSLFGFSLAALATPAIVRASSIMSVVALPIRPDTTGHALTAALTPAAWDDQFFIEYVRDRRFARYCGEPADLYRVLT